jgi:UDP-N-acetylmuramyl pentapeptide synthase
LPAHCLAECEDFDALLAVLDCCLDDGDVVLVKGSRALHMERVIEWLRSQSTEEQQTRRLVAAA